MGGFAVMALSRSPLFADPLRAEPSGCGGCCGPKKSYEGAPVWKFWQDAERREAFGQVAATNAMFLLKWLSLAYLVEALMLRHVPADMVAGVLGGEGPGPILLGAVVGAPAYLNGYAAVPMVDALLARGMSQGAAMSFMLAGGVSCIPAAIAVWALVKPRIFVAYIALAMAGALLAGLAWQAVA